MCTEFYIVFNCCADLNNTIFTVNVVESRTVQCGPGDQGSTVGLSCEFCYGLNSCNNSLITCINTTITDSLSEVEEAGTYCYRVTAFIDGLPVAVIQDSFTYRGASLKCMH